MTGEDAGEPRDAVDTPAELWTLSTPARVLHWVGVIGLVGVVGNGIRAVIVGGWAGPAAGAGLFALAAVVWMLRSVVMVYLDPDNDTVTLFRAGGPALRTRPGHVRRLDRGLLEATIGPYWTRYHRTRPPGVRIVTDEGTATLSVLFAPDTESDLAQALLDHNPDHCQVEL